METELILGLATGLAFGIFLQQGRVLRFEKQIGAMLLKDMTILKVIMTAVVVGMVGINLLVSMELVEFKIKSTLIAANLVGGLLFGAGWAVMGYCPGTSVGAIGEGRWHAIFAVIGMLAGAAVYAEVFPSFKDSILTWGDSGKLTLATMLGVSPWILIPVLSIGFILMMGWFEKQKI